MEQAGDVGLPITPSLLRQHVRAMRELASEGRPIAVRTTSTWSGPAVLDVDGWPVDVVPLVSPLHARELLAEREGDGRGLLLLCPFSRQDLGLDLESRFAGRTLLMLDPWTLVIDAFKARDIDPQLLRHKWMAAALLEAMPPAGFTPVAAGVLDAETAWGLVLEGRLGLTVARPDAVALLTWTADATNLQRFRGLSSDVQKGVRAWLTEGLGPLATTVMDAALTGHDGDAIALGLVCTALFNLQAPMVTHPDAREAVIRLEALVGSRAVGPATGGAWAAAALTLVRQRGRDARQVLAWLERGDALLGELGAGGAAWRSEVLPRGFEQRCERAATAIRDALDAALESAPWLAAVRAIEQVAAHRAASSGTALERLERLQMALRLVGWLARVGAPQSLAEAAKVHVADDGFADWARTALRSGDPSQAVAATLSAIESRVRDRVRARQAAFAALLAEWLVLGSPSGPLTVERVLLERLAPAAQAAPVLLLVIDGMSAAVFSELAESLQHEGWLPLSTGDRSVPEPVVSVLPSVTECSRTSLLTGALQSGAAAQERSGFAGHPSLLAASLPGKAPVLFHKATIIEGASGPGEELRAALEDRERRVVGVVINAVDDHLLKADQIRSRWTLSTVPSLHAVLHVAREAGRLVAVTADHGHVLDVGSTPRTGGTSDRWRPADAGPPSAGEVLLEGTRVLNPGNRCVAATDEGVRYRSKKNGYHGGATAQEVVVPLAWFWTGDTLPAGWKEAAIASPPWWGLTPPAVEPPVAMAPPPKRPATARPSPSRPLLVFADEARLDDVPPPPSLVIQLIRSEVYVAQRTAHARLPLADERVQQALIFLLARGGRTTKAALAAHLDVPPFRLAGLLTAFRAVLNVDGYGVLTIDDAGEAVLLNVDLLRTQFGL